MLIERNKEPTDEMIKQFLDKHPGESYYTAREKLRDLAYSNDHDKPDHISWGDYWKAY